MIPPHIRSASALVTSHHAVCDGFLSQALTKTEKASPYVLQARRLWQVLTSVSDISTVGQHNDIQEELLFAAGFSGKARSHLTDDELSTALKKVLETITSRTPDQWREEIVYRYLLTKGDSLGGSMRNITGALAGKQFSDAVINALEDRHIAPSIVRSPSNPEKIQTISWNTRLLLFDKKPNFVGNNIDVILMNIPPGDNPIRQLLENKAGYLSCGELKAGIDPAGADEHWKTANSALERIRQHFTGAQQPALFFVGAAIETAMAKEIFNQLKDARLAYAANFTVPQQVADLASWLVRL